MKCKKANLLTEQTLKMVIALICIGFLVSFLVSLYFNSVKDEKLEFAESSLNSLIGDINSGQVQVEIYNPTADLLNPWSILSFPFEDKIPKKCLSKGWASCLCICNGDNSDKCDKKGVCLQSDFSIVENGNHIKIENPPLILIVDYGNKIIEEQK